jgi:Rod binding domain-containing protein
MTEQPVKPDIINTITPQMANTHKKLVGKEIDDAAEQFEAVFLSQMLAPMWQGIETDGMFGGGSAEETYRGMMINEYGSMIAKSGGVGIADAVKSELLKLQEKE